MSQLCGKLGKKHLDREISSTRVESEKKLSIFENLKVAEFMEHNEQRKGPVIDKVGRNMGENIKDFIAY